MSGRPHGGWQKQHPLRNTYDLMKRRCFRSWSAKWERYGGRGITVCADWLGPNGFRNFIESMGPRPTGTSLDRINNDGNYEPGNCRWATAAVQARNYSKKPGWTSGTVPSSKLSDELVRSARVRRAAGERLLHLAAEYGVDRKTLRQAIRGVTWSHVK
jgi:hypothetical protein